MSSGGSVFRHDDLSGQPVHIHLSHAQHVDPVMSIKHGSVWTRFQTVLVPRRKRALQRICVQTREHGKLRRAEEVDTVQRGKGWLIADHAAVMRSA